MCHEGTHELRAYVNALREGHAYAGTLLPSIERFAAKFSLATGIEVNIESSPGLSLHDGLAAQVFQMIVEGLSNIRRHTRARRAQVRLCCEENRLVLRIENAGDETEGNLSSRNGQTKPPSSFSPRSIGERARAGRHDASRTSTRRRRGRFRGHPSLNSFCPLSFMTSTSPASPIRLIIIDDHVVVRAGLRMLIENRPGFEVVGEASTLPQALQVAQQQPCDVVLLDLDMGGQDGSELIVPLMEMQPDAQVLILTGMRDPTIPHQVTALGARGIVMKEHASEALLKAIECVHRGELWMDRSLMASVIADLRCLPETKVDPEAAKIGTLTPREREVIALIGEGLKNKDIAKRLFLSETTVRHHLTSVFAKLDVSDRLELVIYAYRHGLIQPGA